MSEVILHALAAAHIPGILSACADWQELSQHGPPYWRPRSEAELQRKITATAGPQPPTDYTFVIQEEDGTLVGECSLHGIDWRSRHGQVGVCIWREADRHRGYGRLGVQHIMNWATNHLGLRRLEAWILTGNHPSISLFESLGFAREATLRQRYFQDGTHHDVHVFAFLPEASES